MPILNYTTTVSAIKTISEIEEELINHHVKSIMKEIDNGKIAGLSFLLETDNGAVPVRMPVRIREFMEVMKMEKKAHPKSNIKVTEEQAERVAWRILKDWIEAQMALIDINMVKMEEVFLPYTEISTGETVFERIEKTGYLIGKTDSET